MIVIFIYMYNINIKKTAFVFAKIIFSGEKTGDLKCCLTSVFAGKN